MFFHLVYNQQASLLKCWLKIYSCCSNSQSQSRLPTLSFSTKKDCTDPIRTCNVDAFTLRSCWGANSKSFNNRPVSCLIIDLQFSIFHPHTMQLCQTRVGNIQFIIVLTKWVLQSVVTNHIITLILSMQNTIQLIQIGEGIF